MLAVRGPGAVALRAREDLDGEVECAPGLVPRLVAIPAAVVEVLVVIGNLRAADPVDRHALLRSGEYGRRVVPCVDVGGAGERPEARTERAQGGPSVGRRRPDVPVVGDDARSAGVPLVARHEQQPEPFAGIEAGRCQPPGHGHLPGDRRLVVDDRACGLQRRAAAFQPGVDRVAQLQHDGLVALFQHVPDHRNADRLGRLGRRERQRASGQRLVVGPGRRRPRRGVGVIHRHLLRARRCQRDLEGQHWTRSGSPFDHARRTHRQHRLRLVPQFTVECPHHRPAGGT